MSAFASTASASAASPAAPPKLPTIEEVHGHGCTTMYDLTLYKLSNVREDQYSDDDKIFYNKFDDTFKDYLRVTINSREKDELSDAKKGLCIGWVNGVTIQKNDTTTSGILRRMIGNDICGLDMDSEFLTNRYADLKHTPDVGVLVMLVTINITTTAKVVVFPVFCLSFSILRIVNNPVLVINGVCTQKRYLNGCPLYALLFYKAVEHCITSFTKLNVITILSALAEAVAAYLRSGFGPHGELDSNDPLRKFIEQNLSDYGSDYVPYIIELAIKNQTQSDPTGMSHPSVIAANNAYILAPVTTLQRKPSNKIPNMQAAQAAAKLQAEAQVERDRLAQEQVDRSKAYNALHKKAKKAYDTRQSIRTNVKKKYTVNPFTSGGRTKKNKKISRKRTFTSKNRKNKKHRKQKTKRR